MEDEPTNTAVGELLTWDNHSSWRLLMLNIRDDQQLIVKVRSCQLFLQALFFNLTAIERRGILAVDDSALAIANSAGGTSHMVAAWRNVRMMPYAVTTVAFPRI